MSQRDYALNIFSRKLEDAYATDTCPTVAAAVKEMKELKSDVKLKSGWALPEKKSRKPFGTNVVTFLLDCFDSGEKNRKPMNPVTVANLMLSALNKDGTKRFTVDEHKDPRQIASFFSREAEKIRTLRSVTLPEISTTTVIPFATTTKSTKRGNKHRRSLHFLHRRRWHPHHHHSKRSTTKVEDFVESEDEHPDAGWIRFLRMEEFWVASDEVYNATLENYDSIFLK